MIIDFVNDKLVYSFNEDEIKELNNLKSIFDQYGSISLSSIRKALSTKFMMWLIPIMYKVYAEIEKDIVFDLQKDLYDSIFNNSKIYTEFGILIRYYKYKQNVGHLDDAPKYIIDEINKYSLEYDRTRYHRKIITYNCPKNLFENYYDIQERPYDFTSTIYDYNNKEKYW